MIKRAGEVSPNSSGHQEAAQSAQAQSETAEFLLPRGSLSFANKAFILIESGAARLSKIFFLKSTDYGLNI